MTVQLKVKWYINGNEWWTFEPINLKTYEEILAMAAQWWNDVLNELNSHPLEYLEMLRWLNKTDDTGSSKGSRTWWMPMEAGYIVLDEDNYYVQYGYSILEYVDWWTTHGRYWAWLD